jgi:hypothetical protein
MVLPIASFALHAFPRSGIISSDIVLLVWRASGALRMTVEKPDPRCPNVYYSYIANAASTETESLVTNAKRVRNAG